MSAERLRPHSSEAVKGGATKHSAIASHRPCLFCSWVASYPTVQVS